jgi:hypothetical protein
MKVPQTLRVRFGKHQMYWSYREHLHTAKCKV